MEVQGNNLFFRAIDYVVSRSPDFTFSELTSLSMLVCAVLCAIQAVRNIGSPVFAKMIISLISTYGVYIVSSLLALDPW